MGHAVHGAMGQAQKTCRENVSGFKRLGRKARQMGKQEQRGTEVRGRLSGNYVPKVSYLKASEC